MQAKMAIIKYGLQPGLMLGTLTLWYYNPESLWVYPLIAIGAQIFLGVLEYLYPARRDWLQPPSYKLALSFVFIGLFIFSVTCVVPLYMAYLNPLLDQTRLTLGINIWPKHWPLLTQVFLAFFLSEFIWYWFHRAEHRWQWFWRLSGHGAHHAFKKLGAINAGTNHPLELLLVLSLPSAIVELVFGAGMAVVGSTLLVITTASIAHSNLDLNTKVVGWLFTTNQYHIHHHSVVHAESNTNFGCAAILWDRVFGTFSKGLTLETGVAPREPSLWQIFLMPVLEPDDIQTAPLSKDKTAQ
tara:strand:+ start:3244 stop:4137 length:894 start_codon:yes stop_codon:yes gene_type:complete